MTIPSTIERYYTAELFRLIQFELSLKNITVTKHEDLAGMTYVQIGKFTTMYSKDDIICTYSEPEQFVDGLIFTFRGEKHYVLIPKILLLLWPILLWWDNLKVWYWNKYFDLKYKCKELFR